MYTAIYKSPIGNINLTATDDALTGLDWADKKLPQNPNKIIDKVIKQLDEYFAGKRKDFDVPIAAQGTEFQKQAWQALQTIPYAKTVSYKQQAEKLGREKAVRAIGAANGKNPISIIVPCHRVIGANGKLTGYAGGLKVKQFLLAHESKFA